jgi:hypothetical protein
VLILVSFAPNNAHIYCLLSPRRMCVGTATDTNMPL